MNGLQGRSVAVTRARHQAGELEGLLLREGATPLLYPCIDIAPPEDPALLDDALRAAARGRFDWLILTSANTVMALETRLKALDFSTHPLARLKVAAVGPATADEAQFRLGLRVEMIPEAYVSDALAESWNSANGARVLLPQSEIAESGLAQQLRQRGADVTTVPAYRNVIGSGGADLPDLLARGKVDAITFTSGSTVTNCLTRLKAEGGSPPQLNGVIMACIGPKTAAVAEDHGLTIHIRSGEHSLTGLVNALAGYFLYHLTRRST